MGRSKSQNCGGRAWSKVILKPGAGSRNSPEIRYKMRRFIWKCSAGARRQSRGNRRGRRFYIFIILEEGTDAI